jgi:predicted transcriptional regulator
MPKPIDVKSLSPSTKTNAEIVKNILKNHEGDSISKKELKKILKEINIFIEKDELNDILENL